MDNLIFSLNATIPIFLLMVLGMFFRKIGLFDEVMAPRVDKFVFRIALPAALFKDLATQNFFEVWNTKFVIFCFVATFLSISAVILICLTLKDKSIRGEFIQASYRSSAAVLGIAFINNLYGNSGMAPLMIVASVPLYNICAVVTLSVFQPDRGEMDKALIKKTLKGIITNPIILGIVIGLAWSLLQIPFTPILTKTVNNLASLSTPLALISLGSSFDIKKALGGARTAMLSAFIKLVGLSVIFMPIAIRMGFRESYLIAILVMLGSATTPSCYVMSKNMGYEGTFSSTCIMLTTLFCSFTLTLWLFLLKTWGLV